MEYGCRPIGVTIDELINQLRAATSERDALKAELLAVTSQLQVVTNTRDQYDDQQSNQQALMSSLEGPLRQNQKSIEKWRKKQQKERIRMAKLRAKIAKGGLEGRDAQEEKQNAERNIATLEDQIASTELAIANDTVALDAAEKNRNSAKALFEQANQQVDFLTERGKALENNLKRVEKKVTSLDTKLATKSATSSSSSSSNKRNATVADLPPPVAKRGDETLTTAFFRRAGVDPALQAAYDALMAQTGPGALSLARLVGNIAYMYDTEGLRMGMPPVMRNIGLPDNVPAQENAVRESTRQTVGAQFLTLLGNIRDDVSIAPNVRQAAALYAYGVHGLLNAQPLVVAFTAPKSTNSTQHIGWTYDRRGIVYPTSDGPLGRDPSFTGLVEAMLVYVLTRP